MLTNEILERRFSFLGNSNTTEYSYDSNDQLQKVEYLGTQGLGSLVNRDLTYDRAGNRLTDTLSGNGKFIRNVITENANFRYYTDPNGFGNIVQKTNKQTGELQIYDYLTDGKIRKFTKYEKVPNSTQTMAVDYFYDALGRRIAKKIVTPSRNFTQTYSYLASEDKILFAKKGNNEVQMQIDGQGIDEHLAEITIAGIKTFSSDHLGTVINGEVVGTKKTTGSFGETLSKLIPIEQTSNPTMYGYTGRQLDLETGHYYYRNRYYDPQSGRFLTVDPIGIDG
jgi:RHS repeat-associated protein